MSIKPKSTLQLYRDCLRLIKHIAGDSPKATHLRAIVGGQFRANKEETDERKIHEMKAAAERSLSNYFLYEHMQNNQKFDKFKDQDEEQIAEMHQVLVDQAQASDEPGFVAADGDNEGEHGTGSDSDGGSGSDEDIVDSLYEAEGAPAEADGGARQ